MNDFIKEIYSLLEKLQQEITDLEADVSYYERAMRESDLEAERLRVENADLRRELEAENARLKKQCEHLACDVVSAAQDYSAPMSDCRICDYDNFCRRKPGQVEPDVELCEEAVLKACDPKEAGE
jgi:regulator of replication initiation timing